MNKFLRNRLQFGLVFSYTLLAFVWWTLLLLRENDENFRLRMALLNTNTPANQESVVGGGIAPPDTKALEAAHRRGQYMIVGEGLVLMLFLLVGLAWVRRSLRREGLLFRLQRNFLLSITHEFKSPLAGIRLSLETIDKRKLTTAQTQQLLGNAHHETLRLQSLVEKMLLATHIEALHHIVAQPTDLLDLVKRAVQHFSTEYPDAIIKLQANEAEDFIVSGESTLLQSLVNNLLENALKYSPLEKVVFINLTLRSDAVVLEVADKGIGITAGEKPLIFNKFYRSGNEDTRQTQGTGLGLYIVKQVVEAHRGKIEVKDNKPQGTCFIVTLPLYTDN